MHVPINVFSYSESWVENFYKEISKRKLILDGIGTL